MFLEVKNIPKVTVGKYKKEKFLFMNNKKNETMKPHCFALGPVLSITPSLTLPKLKTLCMFSLYLTFISVKISASFS